MAKTKGVSVAPPPGRAAASGEAPQVVNDPTQSPPPGAPGGATVAADAAPGTETEEAKNARVAAEGAGHLPPTSVGPDGVARTGSNPPPAPVMAAEERERFQRTVNDKDAAIKQLRDENASLKNELASTKRQLEIEKEANFDRDSMGLKKPKGIK